MKSKVVDALGNILTTATSNTSSENNKSDLVYVEQKEAEYNVKIKKLTPNAKIPTRGSLDAAGYDLYADLKGAEKIYINSHETVLIGTGLSVAIPKNTFLGIYPRSGLSSKKGLRPANCIGVVDSDYRGEIMIALHNDTDAKQSISDGERIAQGILQIYIPIKFKEFEDLDDTKRGDGGFGSTGVK